MIKHILETTHNIMKGSLPYQTFARELTNSSDYDDQGKAVVRNLVNALLNRYYRYFYSVTLNEEHDYTTEEILALALYSFNVEKKVTTITYEELLRSLPADSQIKIEERYPEDSFPIRIPQSFHSENLALSFAARFSAPLYLIEQLIADIGKKNILRFLSSRPQEACGLINTKVISSDEFFANNPDFKHGEKVDQFTYEGKTFIKKTNAYINNEVILTTRSMLDIAELVATKQPQTLLFVQYEDTSLILLLALLYPEITIHYTADEQKSKYIMQHLVRKFDLENITYVTSIAQTYDLVVTTLSSSSINGNIRHRDFYFRLPTDLTSISESAKTQLAGIKDYVIDDGNLIFVTSTALRAETHYQALTFIRDNPEFNLEKEKQYFHFNPFHETVYYAFFKKGHNDK